MAPDPSTFAKPCAITAGAFCLTHRASTTDPRSEECVAMTLHAEVDRLRAGIEAMCHRWRGSTNPALHMERELRALLDPTEGEGHE